MPIIRTYKAYTPPPPLPPKGPYEMMLPMPQRTLGSGTNRSLTLSCSSTTPATACFHGPGALALNIGAFMIRVGLLLKRCLKGFYSRVL